MTSKYITLQGIRIKFGNLILGGIIYGISLYNMFY